VGTSNIRFTFYGGVLLFEYIGYHIEKYGLELAVWRWPVPKKRGAGDKRIQLATVE